MGIKRHKKYALYISIIMPIHNTGEYLIHSLKSLHNQTLKNFELICVDDASADVRTIQILKEYERIFDFIHIIYLKRNVGAGEARNIGFASARGEYVIFLDADDIFDRHMLEVMYNGLRQEKAEVCICGYEKFFRADGKMKTEIVRVRAYDKDNLSDDWLLYNSPNPWTKLCRRDFLIRNNIFFLSIPSCEDVFWSCLVQIKARKICFYEDKPLVSYRTDNPRQITATRSGLYIYNAMLEVLKRVEEEHLGEDIMKSVILLFIWLEIGEIRRAKKTDEIEQCHLSSQRVLSKYIDNISYCSELYNGLLYSFMLSDFIEKRFPYNMSFLEQLTLSKESIVKKLDQRERIVLWGNGKRGEAFQQFCKNNSIDLWAIADSENKDVGEVTAYGYKIISTDEALRQADLMVASNYVIFQYLKKMENDKRIFNLQDFCPLD